jgi:hypothetical protein
MSEYHYSPYTSAFAERAQILFERGDAASLIYAALEIRMGVEARLQSYVHAHEEISRQIKNGWKIKQLAKGIEKHFRESNVVTELTLTDQADNSELVTLYYIPISRQLKLCAEQLGGFLHYREYKVERNDEWWLKLKDTVQRGLKGLKVCAQANLLGPPIWKPESGQVDLKLEFANGDPRLPILEMLGRTRQLHTVAVKFIPTNEYYQQHER